MLRLQVLEALSFRTYLPGEYIIVEFEIGEEMFCIERGQVDVYAPTTTKHLKETGHESLVIIATLNEGDFFGEAALLQGVPRTASCRYDRSPA
jgi:CRP-like cAMP-binding protein